jgi:hypothetical protein
MAWSASSIFRPFVTDALANLAAFDLDATGVDTFKAALYNNSITPDKDATSANSAYNAGQWANTNEVTSSGQWAAGGVALTSPALSNPSSGVVMWDASDTASGSTATLSSVFGVLVYDDTLASPVADQGVCFNYLGGSNSVVSGTFTVVWNANGLFRITVT